MTHRATRRFHYVGTGKTAPLALLVLLFAHAPASLAEDYRVSDLEWKNNGAYVVHVGVRWKSQETGEMHKTIRACKTAGPVSLPADSTEIAPNQRAECHLQHIVNKGLPLSVGDEVWLHISIDSGDDKSCRKDDKRVFFDPNANLKATYSSGGTTTLNNRCKWRGIEPL